VNPVKRSSAGVVIGFAVLAGAIGGCGSGSNDAPAAAPAVVAPTPAVISPSLPPAPAPLATPDHQVLSAQQVADTGLPSRVGGGKLSTPTIKRLMQFFEDKVSRAYATGNADQLTHYLAGPMLTGNRATIGLLSGKQKRNVFKIKVQSVTPETNEAHHLIFDMTGDMTVNYFFDPRTHKVLDNGLPGPSQVQFVVFLDQNPKTHTWYWTGEKAGADAESSTGTTTG
jgi:hypothetical protein